MKTKLRVAVAGIVTGALLSLSPLFGLLGGVFGMMRAFNTLGSLGIGDPKSLSDSIGFALIPSVLGIVLCPIGIFTLTISLIFFFRGRASSPSLLPVPTGI